MRAISSARFRSSHLNGPKPFCGSRPSTMLRVTDRSSQTARSWNTVAMPRARASAGLREDHRLAAKAHLAPVGREDAGEDLDQRRLAGAVVAEKRQDAARIGLQRHVDQRGGGAEGLRNVDRLDHRHGTLGDRPTGRSAGSWSRCRWAVRSAGIGSSSGLLRHAVGLAAAIAGDRRVGGAAARGNPRAASTAPSAAPRRC